MFIYATILRNFIMYIICILVFHLTYTNPPPPAPSPLLMKHFDIFLAIRKTLFSPQSSSKSLPYESYKIIASEFFCFSICYLSRKSGLQSCNLQKFHFLLLVNGGGGGWGGRIVYKMECLYRAQVP